STPTP
ncbi:hypothetical protein D041_4062B, partial [Vibrio parahaemolyticus EKP-008]